MKGSDGQKARGVRVSMYPLDLALVRYLQDDLHAATNDSAAVRVLMRRGAQAMGLDLDAVLEVVNARQAGHE